MNPPSIIRNTAVFLLCLLFSVSQKAHAQVSWDTVAVNPVNACLKPELLRIAVTVVSAGSGSYFEVSVPAGFAYSGIAFQSTPSGNAISYAGSAGNKYKFSIGGTPASGAVLRLWVRQTALCAAISRSAYQDTVLFYNGSATYSQTSNTANINFPSLTITAVSHTPSTVAPGDTTIRKFKITNAGLGSTANIRVLDDWFDGALTGISGTYVMDPAGVAYAIPVSRISNTQNDLTIALHAVDIQQIGDGDSLFENSESFELQYQLSAISCGNSSNQIQSDIAVSWLCNGTASCKTSVVKTGISAVIPAPPVFQITGRRDVAQCFDGTTPSTDTITIINTGGAARNLILNIANSVNNSFQNSTSRIDTGAVFIRTGRWALSGSLM